MNNNEKAVYFRNLVWRQKKAGSTAAKKCRNKQEINELFLTCARMSVQEQEPQKIR